MRLLLSILCVTSYHLVTSKPASIRPITPTRGKFDYFHDTEIAPDGSNDLPPDVLILPLRNNQTFNETRSSEEEIPDVTGSNSTHVEVRLAQSSGCETYHTPEGFIETTIPYSDNSIECYVIQSPAQFLLTWTDRFDIEDDDDCEYDYVEVYQHFNEEEFSGALVGVYCGTTFPSSAVATGPLIVRFISDADVTGSGFRLNWELNSGNCDPISGSGTISTPNHPSDYPNNLNICHRIDGEFVRLTFSSFELEYHPGCDYDYLSITTGDAETMRYCGTSAPDNTIYPGPVTVVFYSDSSVVREGFELTYQVLETTTIPPTTAPTTAVPITDCTTMSPQSGTIVTPNYPQNYGMDVDQCWRIEAEQVQLTFNDFELEEEGSCAWDYVILNLNGVDSKHCGDTAPPSGVFDGPVTIIFHSDGVVSRKGFSIDYQKINEGEEEEEEDDEDEDDCTIDTDGERSTTNHPNNYPHFENWCITIPGERVRLTFVGQFSLEPSNNCVWDYLSITVNGVTEKYCGRDGPESGIFDGPVVIAFHSDYTGSANGFRLLYQSLEVATTSSPTTSSLSPTTASTPPLGCEQYTSSGVRSTSNYPGRYNNDEDWCVFILAKNVRLTFDDQFNIESHPDCGYDYLLLAERGEAEEKFCGSNAPTNKVYAGPVTMRFYSDFTAKRRGFRVQFEPITDAESTLPASPMTTTPDYDGPCEVRTGSGTISHWIHSGYDHNDEWCIIIYGERIQVTFDSVDIEECSRCNCDYVSITMRSQTTRYCDGNQPPSRQFLGPITVAFRSDATINGKGFRLSYTQLDNTYHEGQNSDFPCGRRSNPTTTIIDGDNADHGEWPWQLLLYAGGSRCGATLLSAQWAVTAAHCVADPGGNMVAPDMVSLTSGEHTRSIPEQTEAIHEVDDIILHPELSLSTIDLYPNDIALIHIKDPVIFNNFVRPVCLTRDVIAAGESCMATGWGQTNPYDVQAEQTWDVLQEVELTTVNNILCGSYYTFSIFGLSADHLCTFNDQKAICQGDSGGPLVCEQNNKYYLHGVTSFSGAICGSTPSGFQRVSHHIDWILENTWGEVSLTED